MISDDDLDNRFTYHPPGPDDPEVYQAIRNAAKALAVLVVKHTPSSREQSLAITAIEEAVFWANAAKARHGSPTGNGNGGSEASASRTSRET